jgi:hypothetical protein
MAQMWRVLLMVLRFALFPYCLNALLVFFCRSEEQLPTDVLRSDPSIVCWDGPHLLAVAAGITVVAACGVIAPLLLLRALKQTIDKQQTRVSRPDAPGVDPEPEGLSTQEKARFARVFTLFDRDGNGSIDKHEMLHLLEERTRHEGPDRDTDGWCRQQLSKLAKKKPMSERSAEEMRGWLGLSVDEDVSLDSFIQMLERLKRQLKTSVHDQECATALLPVTNGCHSITARRKRLPAVRLRTHGRVADRREGAARHAVTDPLSMLYYPFRAECYWWSIVLLLRPAVIALSYNARNRQTGVQHPQPRTSPSAMILVI